MLQLTSATKSIYLWVYLLLTAILIAILSCTHNTSSNLEKEPEEFEAEIVSIKNPNITIQPPVNFAWLPQSIKAYDDPGLKDLSIQETIQEAITESLTRNGYLYNKSAYARKTLIVRKRSVTNIQPKDLIVVKSWKWAGANFGASGFLKNITLDNRSNHNVKDIKIKIGYLGTMGHKEGYWGPTSIFVIHDLLPAKSEKTFRDINIGFRHPDERKENMNVLSVKTIIDDLLIGYTLVRQNTINDQDINSTYHITAEPSGNNQRINEYKKGSLIIDVIDPETNLLVWRGATRALTSFAIPADTKQDRIKLAVDKLVNNFIMSNK